MAKSIRSKAKRILRAAKRVKVAAKQRAKLLAIQEQEDIQMVQDTIESNDLGEICVVLFSDTLFFMVNK